MNNFALKIKNNTIKYTEYIITIIVYDDTYYYYYYYYYDDADTLYTRLAVSLKYYYSS